MCELFALSSRHPATVDFSLEELARRGGETGPHKDGWGIAYYEDDDVRLIREPSAASESDWLRFVEAHHLRSRTVVSHIRKATIGKRQLSNTQPFSRELGGRMHVFAHNGHLPGIQQSFALGMHRPIGGTDSEHAFCALLARLEQLWLSLDEIPSFDQRLEAVAAFAADLRALGLANFIYADGATLFAHGHRRPHGTDGIRPPGLCMLRRRCSSEEPSLAATGVTVTLEDQDVVLLASVPLTDEPWAPLGEGEVVAVKDGEIAVRAMP
ncbi:MAG: class II glutamine amidotransferase [Methyloligellaceae bacterium]